MAGVVRAPEMRWPHWKTRRGAASGGNGQRRQGVGDKSGDRRQRYEQLAMDYAVLHAQARAWWRRPLVVSSGR